MKRRFIIAAGGTGGHIIPGFQIGRELANQFGGAVEVEYICGSRTIEKRIYEEEGVLPARLSTGASRLQRWKPIRDAALCLDAMRTTLRFLVRRPAGVLAMGGAACFPVLAAAVVLRIPIFLHESNRIPGRVVRLFRRFARKTFLGMPCLAGKDILVTGTPAKGSPPASADAVEKDTVLCLGGSQGASRLNEVFIQAVKDGWLAESGMRFVLIAGPGKQTIEPGPVEIREYEPDLPSLLRRARVLVSRAGAGTLADIANYQIPSILVPYPHAKDNHQEANARYFTERGAAYSAGEEMLSPEILAGALEDLIDSPEQREDMCFALARLATPDAAQRIAEEICHAIKFAPPAASPSAQEARQP